MIQQKLSHPIRIFISSTHLMLFAYDGVSCADGGVKHRQDILNEYFLKEFNMGISASLEWINETRTNHAID